MLMHLRRAKQMSCRHVRCTQCHADVAQQISACVLHACRVLAALFWCLSVLASVITFLHKMKHYLRPRIITSTTIRAWDILNWTTTTPPRLSYFLSPLVFSCLETLYLRKKPALCSNQWWSWIWRCPLDYKLHSYSKPCEQHPTFLSGFPSKHCPGPMLLNFSVQMGSVVFNRATDRGLHLK